MKRLIITLCFTVILAFGSFGVGWSGDRQKGYDAYSKDDYTTALKELTPLAEEGDAIAQYWIGRMYGMGLGVLQDYNIAVKWTTLSAEQGLKEAQYN